MVNKKEYKVVRSFVGFTNQPIESSAIDLKKLVKGELARQLAEYILKNMDDLPVEYEEYPVMNDRHECVIKVNLISDEALREYKKLKNDAVGQ